MGADDVEKLEEVEEEDEESVVEEKKTFTERLKDGGRKTAAAAMLLISIPLLKFKLKFLRAAPPKPSVEVQEMMSGMGLTPKHLAMIYKVFHRLGQYGLDQMAPAVDVVDRESLPMMVRTRVEWVKPLLLVLSDLGGCLPPEEGETTMVPWDDFLYMMLRFNSMTRVELAQFMFLAIVMQLRSPTLHYLTDWQLDQYYETFRASTIRSFAPREVWFKDMELRRYYATDFVEVCQRFDVLLNPAVHLQRETRAAMPSTHFWNNYDPDLAYNRKLTMEFFMIRKTHVFLRGEPPLRETCDLLLPTAMGYDHHQHYHPKPKPMPTMLAMRYEQDRYEKANAKPPDLRARVPDPLALAADDGRTRAFESRTETIGGRIRPPVLNKDANVRPQQVGGELSSTLQRARAQQRYDATAKSLQNQLQFTLDQSMTPQQQATYGGKNTGGAVAKAAYRPGPPQQGAPGIKAVRKPPPVSSAELPAWLRDIPLGYIKS
jgi:hypothetical protein